MPEARNNDAKSFYLSTVYFRPNKTFTQSGISYNNGINYSFQDSKNSAEQSSHLNISCDAAHEAFPQPPTSSRCLIIDINLLS